MSRPIIFSWLIPVSLLVIGLQGFAAGSREGQPQQPGERSETEESLSLGGPEGYPLTVNDEAGYPVHLPAKPRRIISLTSFTDDILLELVEHERLLGVTNFSADPAISNVADKIADISHRLTMNVEVIVSLRPDLVLVANWSEAEKVVQLREAGIPVYLIATGLSISAIEEKIEALARLVGEPRRGEALVSNMERRLQRVRRVVAAIPEGQRLSVMDYATWGSAQGAGSTWDEVVRHAGLINAVGEFPADEWGQVPLSREKILELDPDLLVLPDWEYGNPQGADAFYDQIVDDPALRGLKAIRQGRVYRMPEGLKSAASQYVVDAVEYLARLAYPQLFP